MRLLIVSSPEAPQTHDTEDAAKGKLNENEGIDEEDLANGCFNDNCGREGEKEDSVRVETTSHFACHEVTGNSG